MTLGPIVADLLLYLLCASLLVSAGIGILALFGIRADLVTVALLAPVVTQALWGNCLGIGVALRAPVRWLAGPLLAVTLVAAAYGLFWLQKHGRREIAVSVNSPRLGLWLGICLLLPLLVTFPYVVYGFSDYPGSGYPDGWAYTANAQYLWSFPRGAEGGLTPLYQYAAYLADTRHIGSSHLAILSVLTSPGDTQSATGLFLTTSLFAFTTSCGAFARIRGLSTRTALLFLFVTVLSGWLINVLIANNYDNLLALPYFPFLAAMALAPAPPVVRWWLLVAGVAASFLYTYPELGIIVCGIWAAMLMCHFQRLRAPGWIGRASAGGLLLILLTAPYAGTLGRFVTTQFAAAVQEHSKRPGEGMFPELLTLRTFPSAFWGFIGERQVLVLSTLSGFAAIVLFVALVAGIIRLLHERDFGALAPLALSIVGAPFLLIGQTYSYGAYKFMLMGWWVVAYTLVIGAVWANESSRWRLALTTLSVTACLAIPAVSVARIAGQTVHPPQEGMSRFRSVSQVAGIVGNEPIGVFVDNWEASQWAAYYLRDHPTRLGDVEGYMAMPIARAHVDRAVPIPWRDLRFILTDAVDPGPVVESEHWTLMWHNSTYRLWDTVDRGWAIATDVTNPNGLGHVDGVSFLWLGGGPTRFRIIARDAACLTIASRVEPGPSVSQTDYRNIRLESSSQPSKSFQWVPGIHRLGLALPTGVSEVTLIPQDSPDVTRLGPDTRPLVVGLTAMTSTLESAWVRLIGILNPNGLETMDGEPFFWMGGGVTEIRISARAASDVAISADLVLGPSVEPTVPTRHLQLAVLGRDDVRDFEVSDGPWAIQLAVTPGDTVVRLETRDVPTILKQANGDIRPLIVGLRGLRAEARNFLGPCG